METNKIIISEDRGLISISGRDVKDFLQNITSNDIEKVSKFNTIFSAIFTPQGKYLYEFFIIKSEDGYYLECENKLSEEIISHLIKYKLRSNIIIKNLSSSYVVGLINLKKFKEIQKNENKNTNTFLYRDSPVFIDPRNKELGARVISTLEKLHLTIKKLNLKITDNKNYLLKAHLIGIPIIGVENLKNKLFGLEANFEELGAIDFKKGCYVGQENTARMKLKNKLRKRLLPIKSDEAVKIDTDLKYEGIKIGKILIGGSYSFALIKLFDPNLIDFKDKDLLVENKKVKIINNY
jgi:tRNA-modifying protein YgfZ